MTPDTKVCPSCGEPCSPTARWCIADYCRKGYRKGQMVWKPYHFGYADIAFQGLDNREDEDPLFTTYATRIRRTA